MVLLLSANRMDRFPLHLSRWKGDMSVAIRAFDNEIPDLLKILSSITRNNIRFTIQVIDQSSSCTFIYYDKRRINYSSCFEINLLRNLAIETIKTTHFILVDGDAIISSKIV